jgi:hypothetical protein
MVLQNISRCDLLFPFDCREEVVVARGMVYPTSHTTLHGCQIQEGFVKVQVDTVLAAYESVPVHPTSKTDEIGVIGDTRSQFVQWPISAIKVYILVLYLLHIYYRVIG